MKKRLALIVFVVCFFITKIPIDIEQGKDLNKLILFLSVSLIIYWIIILLIFERDKKYKVSNINEEELFEKYNPLIAGCIQGNRDILSRDIIAVILNLINKGNIRLTIKGDVNEKSLYNYIVEKVPEKENEMDEIELLIYKWLFTGEKETLIERLQEMPKVQNANFKFKELDGLAKKELKKLGANKTSVPNIIKAINVMLLCGAIFLVVYHIKSIKFDEKILPLMILAPIIFALIPLIPKLVMNITVKIRHLITNNIQNAQKITTTSISIIIISLLIMAITYWILKIPELIADELLISVTILIVITDDLMLKNNVNMIEDYSRLNCLKEKLENTLLNEKDIGQIYLWNEYLAYAVSFGIGKKIIDKISGIYTDNDLLNYVVNNNEMLDYIENDYRIFYAYINMDKEFMEKYKKGF